jgi:predicted lipoprotein with Yx(FWY)xxD motif
MIVGGLLAALLMNGGASAKGVFPSAHLTDVSGMAVYFLERGRGAGACDRDCVLLWPAVPRDRMTSSHNGLLGELRRDETVQATYGGRALYYFAEDLSRGEANGDRFQEFGRISYLVTPSGGEVGGKIAPDTTESDDDRCGCADRPYVDTRFAVAFASNHDAARRWLSRLLTRRAVTPDRVSAAFR